MFLAGVSNAIEASPSDTSLRRLDVAVFLAEQNWTQQNIGFVLTAAGFAELPTQRTLGT
jgi:hypothetical protein